MTCIVGLKHDRGVLLGADSLAVTGNDGVGRLDPKVFSYCKEVAVGFTWSYRMGQILRFHLDFARLLTASDWHHDEYAWAVKDFVPAARAAMREQGFAKIADSREEGGVFLLAVRHRLFKVESDWQVGESAEPYSACGIGEDYALGSLFTSLRDPLLSSRDRAERALLASSNFSIKVAPPFVFAETEIR